VPAGEAEPVTDDAERDEGVGAGAGAPTSSDADTAGVRIGDEQVTDGTVAVAPWFWGGVPVAGDGWVFVAEGRSNGIGAEPSITAPIKAPGSR